VVELPKGPCPTLIDTMGERGELAVRVHPGATDVAELEVTSGEVRGILEMPPAMEGALYLVEDEVLLRCPHRSDLVTPTLYRWIVAEGHDVSAVADDPEDWLGESLGRITVLSAVAGKLGVAGEDTPTQMI
jgi:hypothetical protein